MVNLSLRLRGAAGAVAVAAAIGTTVVSAGGMRFSDFTPLPGSSGPAASEAQPISFGNAAFQQKSIASRQAQLADGIPNSGNFDMLTVNETGPDKGSHLFTVFETGQSGIQRQNLDTGETDTIWYALNPGDAVAFDAAYWTPWGTFITAEESWCVGAACDPGEYGLYGRLFELKNPLNAPGISLPLSATSNDGADLVHQNIIPRVSHEGIQFDKAGNMYFIDEFNGGSLYRYTPAATWGDIISGHKGYFDAGQTSVLRVGDGMAPNATGAFTWVPLTDEEGSPLPGTVTFTAPTGDLSMDGRATTDLPAFKGTDYQRPEDMQIQSQNGSERLYVTTTTTHETYVLDLEAQQIRVFANRNTLDLATRLPVGSALANPDNLAVDHEGNIYIVEDRAGGVDDDIWFALDLNKDSDLIDAGEGIGRWASNGTPGSEFTGLYFDHTDKRRAWVNIQHPASQNDRTIEITLP